jgi:hypothetical protein
MKRGKDEQASQSIGRLTISKISTCFSDCTNGIRIELKHVKGTVIIAISPELVVRTRFGSKVKSSRYGLATLQTRVILH